MCSLISHLDRAVIPDLLAKTSHSTQQNLTRLQVRGLVPLSALFNSFN